LAARDQWDDIPAALSSLAIDGPVDLLSRAALTESLADRARRGDVPIARHLYERALPRLTTPALALARDAPPRHVRSAYCAEIRDPQ